MPISCINIIPICERYLRYKTYSELGSESERYFKAEGSGTIRETAEVMTKNKEVKVYEGNEIDKGLLAFCLLHICCLSTVVTEVERAYNQF